MFLTIGGFNMSFPAPNQHTPNDHHSPWNKGKIIGQKQPLKIQEMWAIQIHLELGNKVRDLTWPSIVNYEDVT